MTIGLVVYDGLESLHCGADSTSAISTNARRLVLSSGRTGTGQGVRPAERSRWLFEQPVRGRLARGNGVSWCLSADVWQDAFTDSVK